MQAVLTLDAAQVETAPVPIAVVQSVPLQHRLGCWFASGVQKRPGAHLPVESQRQPLVPAMQVDERPVPASSGLMPHTLGTPPQPQHSGAAQVPQSSSPQQPGMTPQFLPADAQSVANTQKPHSFGTRTPHWHIEQWV
jgi:hypothetical protein